MPAIITRLASALSFDDSTMYGASYGPPPVPGPQEKQMVTVLGAGASNLQGKKR